MDPASLSTLPTALVDLVLAKLPFQSLISMGLVCKSWNFLIHFGGLSLPNPTRVLLHPSPIHTEDMDFTDGSADYRLAFTAYDSVKGHWQKLSVNCPREVLDQHAGLPTLVATGGGLLCFDISSSTEYNYVVCNPVTSKWKRLPCLELHPRLPSGSSVQWRWRVAGLAPDTNCSRFYKLVVIGFCLENRGYGQNWFLTGTQVYDSSTESWTLTFQDRETMGCWCSFVKVHSKSLFWKDHLYVVTSKGFDIGQDVAIFSMKKGTWIEVPTSHFTKNGASAHLVYHADQVLLVAEERHDSYAAHYGPHLIFNHTQTLGFWKLNIPDLEAMWGLNQPHTEQKWLKLKRVQRNQLPLNIGKSSRDSNWACVGHRNATFFVFCTSKSSLHCHQVLKHDLCRDSWSTSPVRRNSEVESPCNFCSFEPSFNASV